MNNETRKNRLNEQFEAMMKTVKISSIGVAAAIIIACFAFTQIEDLIFCTVLYGVSALVGTVSMMFIFGSISLWRAEKNRRNFFLYDKKAKKDMPISALSFDEVRRRLVEFMSIFKRRGKIYLGDLFIDTPHIPEQFKTLFCYEILYEVALGDGSLPPEVFLGYGDECADIISDHLRRNGDYELAAAVSGYVKEYSEEKGNANSFMEYIRNKKKHIEEKMLGYAVDNIEKFD